MMVGVFLLCLSPALCMVGFQAQWWETQWSHPGVPVGIPHPMGQNQPAQKASSGVS